MQNGNNELIINTRIGRNDDLTANIYSDLRLRIQPIRESMIYVNQEPINQEPINQEPESINDVNQEPINQEPHEPDLVNQSFVDLYVDYVFLNTDARRRMAQNAHEYLIARLRNI
jgi:hypothetical protein